MSSTKKKKSKESKLERKYISDLRDDMDRFAGHYDDYAQELNWTAPTTLTGKLLKAFGLVCAFGQDAPEKLDLLDIGIGTGELSLTLRSSLGNVDISGVDISPEMLEKSRLKKAADRYILQDVSKTPLPYPSEQFDMVASCGMYEYVRDPVPSLTEMARVLKPGGLLAFTTNQIDRRREALRVLYVDDPIYHSISQISKILADLDLELIQADTRQAYAPVDYNFFIARKPVTAAPSTALG